VEQDRPSATPTVEPTGNPAKAPPPARDLLAGITVACVELPQAIGYAILAGVPGQYGVYASIIQGIFTALLSSSRHIVSGPTNTQSLLIASAVSGMVEAGERPQVYLQLVLALTMLKGAMQIGFALLRFGDLVRFVSRSVIVGLAAGAGVLIFVGQIPNFLGISAGRSHLPGVIGSAQQIIPRLDDINAWSVGIGLACVAIILACRAISRFVPGSLIAVIAASAFVAWFGLGDRVAVVGDLPRGLPSTINPWPGWEALKALFPGALAMAALGLIETVAIGKSLASRSGGRIDPNREALAQGCGNFVGSFVQGIAGSASFTRSALMRDAGALSRLAGLCNVVFIAALFVALSGATRYLPLSAIAAVLLVICFGLIDWRYVSRIVRTGTPDASVCLLTFLATLTIPLEYAVFVGIVFNIALYLRNAARLHMNEMVQAPSGPFFERPLHDRAGERQVIFLQLEGELFFGVADELQERLNVVVRSGVRVVILRLKRTHSIDATVLHVLEQFIREMRRRGGYVLLCGVRDEISATIRSYGLVDLIGRENVFYASVGVWSSAKQALARARELVGASIDGVIE
jgi:SulP family sulfate permease